MFNRAGLLILAMCLAGCANFPEKLRVQDSTNLVSYQDAASKAEQVKGKLMRWGGAIAKIENKEKTTILEMVHYPLTSYGRPISADESMGRYRVHVNGFMDPMVYKVGRLMTFTATLEGVENGLVGEHKYVFPSATSKAYYLWKELQRVDIERVNVWPHDYWFDRYPRPYRRSIIIRTSNDSTPKPSRVTSTLPKPVSTKRETR